MNGIEIVSTGYAKIEKTLDNQQLEQMVETSNEWIVSRTGILKRHLSDKSSAFLAIEAAKKATQNQDLSQLALIIVATMTPENNTPSNACLVQKALGLNHQSMMCFDINVACSGYVYALKVAQSLLEENQYGLVIGSEQLSSIVDYQDRNTCILFGDGAGAVVLGEVEDGGYLGGDLQADGSGGSELIVPSSGSRMPLTQEVLDNKDQFVKMNGREIFKFAVKIFPETVDRSLEKANLKIDDIDLIIPHQANIRIIESISKRLNQPLDKFFVNLDKYGNTSAATIPIALDEASKQGRISKGDKVIMVGFGGGLTYGSCIVEWSK